MQNNFTDFRVIHWNYRNLDAFPEEKLKILPECRLDLYLKGNRIEKLPRNPYYLCFLRQIHLNENYIKYLPKEMCRLRYLQYLNISDNLLTMIPDEVKYLRELRTLIIDHNYVERLPLSLQLMPKLKIVSANGNNLLWLPQKIGNNFYSTNFSFWGNKNLHSVPYKIWIHVLKNCKIPSGEHLSYINSRKELKETDGCRILSLYEKRWKFIVPQDFIDIEQHPNISPPSLRELCLRNLYKHRGDTLLAQNGEQNDTTDLILPTRLYDILCNGPTATCDLIDCQSPLFEYAILVANIKYDEEKEYLLVAYFCSKLCSEKWKEMLKIQELRWI